MSKSDNLGFDVAAVHANFMHSLRKLARGTAHDHYMLDKALDAYRKKLRSRKKKTAALVWCDQNAELFAAAARQQLIGPSLGGYQLDRYFAALRKNDEYREGFAAILFAVVTSMYGGRRVWKNKNPTASKLEDAKRMLPADLMRKHGIGRSRAYQLCKMASRPKK